MIIPLLPFLFSSLLPYSPSPLSRSCQIFCKFNFFTLSRSPPSLTTPTHFSILCRSLTVVSPHPSYTTLRPPLKHSASFFTHSTNSYLIAQLIISFSSLLISHTHSPHPLPTYPTPYSFIPTSTHSFIPPSTHSTHPLLT